MRAGSRLVISVLTTGISCWSLAFMGYSWGLVELLSADGPLFLLFIASLIASIFWYGCDSISSISLFPLKKIELIMSVSGLFLLLFHAYHTHDCQCPFLTLSFHKSRTPSRNAQNRIPVKLIGLKRRLVISYNKLHGEDGIQIWKLKGQQKVNR